MNQDRTNGKEAPKKYSLVSRIVMLMMMVICLQSLVSFQTIVFTHIATTVESYSYNSFTRTLTNRRSNLELFMSTGWANISETSTLATARYESYLQDKDSLTEAEKVDFLCDSVESILQMMSMSGTTGGFLLLDDGEDLTYSYSTVYLKSYDTSSQVVRNSNLMLARGPAEVSKEHGFSLVSNWSYGWTLTENTLPLLSAPMDATTSTTHLDHLGYWHISDDVSNPSMKVLTYSVPFFDGDGNPVGVVGVEITQDYLYTFLPENEFGEPNSYGYLLADVTSDHQMTPHFYGSATQELLLSQESSNTSNASTISLTLTDLPLDRHILEATPSLLSLSQEEICVYYEPLGLYTNNSPFQGQDLYLVGMVDLDHITSFTAQFWNVVTNMIFVSLSVGVLISYVMGKWVAQPILKLSKRLETYDPQTQITFTPSRIKEIDELAETIETMHANILRSAGKTNQILELLNIDVGSYEYVTGESHVTLSSIMYKVLHMEHLQGQPIEKDLFFKELQQLKSKPVEDMENIFSVGTEKVFYVKIEEVQKEQVLLGVVEDCTKEVEDLLVLHYERSYDVLTGIYNRRAFHHKAEDLLKHKELQHAGFVMFDLDNLKYVNDTFGHDSGDIYIKTAAALISRCLSPHGVVGRMSGDEFYAFIYGFQSKTELLASLQHFYQVLDQEPIDMPNGTLFKIRVSGGLSWYGSDSSDLEELKQFADFAMYKGKHTTKGELREFDREQYLAESFMLSGKAELNRVLDNELIHFVFQPIIHVGTGEIFGYEALMRPISDTLTSPTKLLQLASLEGKLWKVEKIALFKTLSLYKKHRDLFGDAKLFINSIPSETLKPEEYDQLQQLYQDSFPNIVIEITEQEQLCDTFLSDKLEKLSCLQLDIALDDYGSGYANDMGLIKMNPDIVKIDRSLISNVHVDPSRQAIVQKIISFCKEKNICILGEGIETEEELEYMVEAGIQLAQGFYISRPLDLPNFQNKEIQGKLLSAKK